MPSVRVLWWMPPRCWRCRPISAAAGGHAAAICIAMATCERKLRSSGATPRAGSATCGRRRWEDGHCPNSWRASGPGPRSGPCPVAAHSGPHRTPALEACAWLQRTENRYSDMRMAIYSCFMDRKWQHSHTQKIPFKHHAPHTWYAGAIVFNS